MAVCLPLVVGACSALPTQVERPRSSAILDTAQTRLGRAAAPVLVAHPGLSGFHPLGEGVDAFVARVALARAADRALDVQYYPFHPDDTGTALMGELLAAADRGVRVRLLLDDIHTGDADTALAAIATHPNVEVRLFNPFAHRGARWIDFINDFGRVNRRMHNKAMAADSQLAIVGGRNVGDPYFSAGKDLAFGDFDVLVAGPVVAEVSAQFDEYWNSEVVYPLASLVRAAVPGDDALRSLHARIEERLQALRDTPYARGLEESDLARAIVQKHVLLYWGKGAVIADRPDKVRLPPEERSSHAAPRLGKILEAAREELLLISPYFVPGERGVRWLAAIAERGVRVRVLTNSYAATDVGAVHAGYSAYREALLRAGIEVHELKPDAGTRLDPARKRMVGGASRSSLHAKTYMVDGRTLFVGSFNLDPRSGRLNTEMGVVIENAAMCVELRNRVLQRLPDIAYRLELAASPEAGGRLAWITREQGREVRYDVEPGMGPFDRLMQGLLRLLPLEEQL
jgi:putative cardiolipin synthase